MKGLFKNKIFFIYVGKDLTKLVPEKDFGTDK